MTKMLVDPSVRALAEVFIDDLAREIDRPIVEGERVALVDRAAGAMQRAIEDEYEAIRSELTAV